MTQKHKKLKSTGWSATNSYRVITDLSTTQKTKTKQKQKNGQTREEKKKAENSKKKTRNAALGTCTAVSTGKTTGSVLTVAMQI